MHHVFDLSLDVISARIHNIADYRRGELWAYPIQGESFGSISPPGN